MSKQRVERNRENIGKSKKPTSMDFQSLSAMKRMRMGYGFPSKHCSDDMPRTVRRSRRTIMPAKMHKTNHLIFSMNLYTKVEMSIEILSRRISKVAIALHQSKNNGNERDVAVQSRALSRLMQMREKVYLGDGDVIERLLGIGDH